MIKQDLHLIIHIQDSRMKIYLMLLGVEWEVWEAWEEVWEASNLSSKIYLDSKDKAKKKKMDQKK